MFPWPSPKIEGGLRLNWISHLLYFQFAHHMVWLGSLNFRAGMDLKLKSGNGKELALQGPSKEDWESWSHLASKLYHLNWLDGNLPPGMSERGFASN